MKKIILAIVLSALVAGGGGFYGGMVYGKNAAQQQRGQRGMGFMGGGAGPAGQRPDGASRSGRFAGGGLVMGEILSKTDTSITVKLRDGGSRVIVIAPTTKVMQSTEGKLDDLTTGTSIVVQGSQNSDGSITAESIQVR